MDSSISHDPFAPDDAPEFQHGDGVPKQGIEVPADGKVREVDLETGAVTEVDGQLPVGELPKPPARPAARKAKAPAKKAAAKPKTKAKAPAKGRAKSTKGGTRARK